MQKKLLLIMITAVLFCGNLINGAAANQDQHVTAELISEVQSISPGQPFWVAVVFKMEKDWHIYWQNPGDSGIPTKIQWTLPEGFKAGPTHWPFPKRISLPPLMTYGFEDQVLLLTEIFPSADINTSQMTVNAKVDWLMCKVICIPGKAQISLTLPVTTNNPALNLQTSKDFINARLNLPLATSEWDITTYQDNQNVTLHLSNTSQEPYTLKDIYFFPFQDNLFQHAKKQNITQIQDGYALTIPKSTLSTSPLKQLQGVLYASNGWRGPGSEKALSIDIPVARAPTTMNPITKPDAIILPLALFFAFLGGLILNLMPCVLPVLSIKILSMLKHSIDNKATLWLHGLAYTLGVIACFWILAITLILLRHAGLQIGWGFQFQSPPFLITLSIVFLIFALNLFGVFEFRLPFQLQLKQQQSALTGSFLNGILATVTATPCTAPFMGTALGFALTQSPLISLSIFTALGFGLAFPFLLLTLFPSLLKFLPKPGPWMIHFKRFLGILLLGTVIWLVWILGNQLGFLKENTRAHSGTTHRIEWKTYSSELINALRAQKRLIFIDFTAKWCLSCQVNERIALDNPSVIQKIKDLNIVMVKADWTLQDAKITQALAQYGKNSIPLYVLYGNNASQEPTFLPEILTPKIVLEALEKISQNPINP